MYNLQRDPMFFMDQFPGQIQNNFLIQMNPDFYQIERSVYSFTDLLNDSGGFYTAVYIIFYLLMYMVRSHDLN